MSLLVSMTSFTSFNVAYAAGNAAAGKKIATTTCASCHGKKGISSQEIWPNLKGQKAAYLVAQLKAFKDGSRKNPIMNGMAAGLSDADMENIAAYFSGL